ncbi:Sec1-like protein [Amylocystis lapponica]|nr:Sec1-like protein [Amylocystis lapponica]
MTSLINSVRTKFLDAIRSVNPPGRWKILVVDEHSQQLLGSVLKQFDILEENVTLIESITNYRDPQPQFEAMYLLMSTSQNVDRIIKDFSNGHQQYAAANLFFVDAVRTSNCLPAEPHLKTLQELFINFWAIEAQAFTVKMPGSFFSMYSPPRSENAFRPARDALEEELKFTSKMIMNVCITLNEYPFIRYYVPTHHPPLGSSRWRTNLARGNEARAYESADNDYVSRLLHSWCSVIWTNTRRQTPNGLYKFQTAIGAYEDKTAILSDNDNVWTALRHMHMRETIDKLMADFNQFLQDNAGFKGEGAASLSDMKDMLANLPQYQEQREKFSLHLNMAQECMGIFERDKLPVVATVEQNCATGLTAEGKTPKTLVEEMVPILDGRDVINANKVRIIALYIQYRDGVPDEDRRRLYQHARLSIAEQDAVNALLHLGIRISRAPGDRDTKKRLKQKTNNEDEYELSRYKPLLQTVIEDHVGNRLDPIMFPYVKDAPSIAPAPSLRSSPAPQSATSLRSAKPSWHRAPRSGAGAQDVRQRLIVFVAGGMTYSEMREAYLMSKSLNKDIIIGSTHTLTPRQFIDDLKVLDLGGVGSRAIPNGLRESKGPRPLQAYYDERYFTKDAPPPAPAQAQPRQEHGRVNKPSVPSFASSTVSVNSTSVKEKEERKKKRGLFKF